MEPLPAANGGGRKKELRTVNYQSFGGGPPSAALLILNARGEIQPRAEIVVFADPGSEDPRTYEALPCYREYAELHGMQFRVVKANISPLHQWILERSVPIPAFTSKGMGRRQCTERWKIRPIHALLRRELGYDRVVAQLGMTWEEVWRMRDSPTRYVTNVYPLIDRRLTREKCIEIIMEEGLPIPPRSACVFCPLKSTERWKQTLEETPASFELAVRLEQEINVRQALRGKDPIYLSVKRKALNVLREEWLRNDEAGVSSRDLGQCETGHCFT